MCEQTGSYKALPHPAYIPRPPQPSQPAAFTHVQDTLHLYQASLPMWMGRGRSPSQGRT